MVYKYHVPTASSIHYRKSSFFILKQAARIHLKSETKKKIETHHDELTKIEIA